MKTHDLCYFANKIMLAYEKYPLTSQREEAIMYILNSMLDKEKPWYKKLCK